MKIGLIAALFEEAERLRSTLGGCVYKTDKHGFAVEYYKKGNNEYYYIESGIGEIGAAVAASYLAMKCEVDVIVNFGVVGALNPDLSVGDVVAATEVVHYDFTLDMSNPAAEGIYPDRDTFVFDVNFKRFGQLIKGLPRVRIASGDKFINSAKAKRHLYEDFGCDICDMEAAGLYFAAKKANVPLIMIKSVSDSADENANEQFAAAIKNGVVTYLDVLSNIRALPPIKEGE